MKGSVALIFDGAFFIAWNFVQMKNRIKLEQLGVNNCKELFRYGYVALELCYGDLHFTENNLDSVRLELNIRLGYKVTYAGKTWDLSHAERLMNSNVVLQ